MYMYTMGWALIATCTLFRAHNQQTHKVTVSVFYYMVQGKPLQLLDLFTIWPVQPTKIQLKPSLVPRPYSQHFNVAC